MSRDGKQSSSVVGIPFAMAAIRVSTPGTHTWGSWNQLPLRISGSIDFAVLITAFSQVCLGLTYGMELYACPCISPLGGACVAPLSVPGTNCTLVMPTPEPSWKLK